MNAVLWSPVLVATLTACAGDAPDRAAETRPDDQVSLEAELPDAPLSYVAEDDTIVLRIDMDRVRRSSLADELGAWLEGREPWGAVLSRAGIDPVQDFDRLLAVAPTSDPAASLVVARHRLSPDRIRQAVGAVAGGQVAWRQVQGFEAARVPTGSGDARVVVLTAPNELVVTTPDLFDRVLRVAVDQRARRVAEEAVEPALAFDNGTIATVVALRLNGWAREAIPEPPPEALDVRLTEDGQTQGRVQVHATGTYADPAAAAAAGTTLTERRDLYAGHMLIAAAGLNDEIGESEIRTTGNELDVRTTFSEGDLERVIGVVGMLRQFGR
jgi:hypothetical protein